MPGSVRYRVIGQKESVEIAVVVEIWLIGQKTCYKTAIAIEISMAIAVLSFLKEDRGWTKNVFRMLVNS